MRHPAGVGVRMAVSAARLSIGLPWKSPTMRYIVVTQATLPSWRTRTFFEVTGTARAKAISSERCSRNRCGFGYRQIRQPRHRVQARSSLYRAHLLRVLCERLPPWMRLPRPAPRVRRRNVQWKWRSSADEESGCAFVQDCFHEWSRQTGFWVGRELKVYLWP